MKRQISHVIIEEGMVNSYSGGINNRCGGRCGGRGEGALGGRYGCGAGETTAAAVVVDAEAGERNMRRKRGVNK